MIYLSAEYILSAIQQLASVHTFVGITFLTCKKNQLPIGTPTTFLMDAQTKQFMASVHKICPSSEYYFQPYQTIRGKQWLAAKYPSSGLQAINTQTWAKIVTSEFREKHHKEMGAPLKENRLVEEDIVDKFVTEALVEKEFAKIVNENGGWSSKMIPRLLSQVFHELICEEMWNILKAFKNPTINFRVMNNLTITKIKQVKPEIFG